MYMHVQTNRSGIFYTYVYVCKIFRIKIKQKSRQFDYWKMNRNYNMVHLNEIYNFSKNEKLFLYLVNEAPYGKSRIHHFCSSYTYWCKKYLTDLYILVSQYRAVQEFLHIINASSKV